MNENGRYLRRAGAAKYLGISERCVSDWQKRRIIPFVKVGRKVILFDPAALDKAVGKFVVQAVGAEL